jgi:hypothetical protein
MPTVGLLISAKDTDKLWRPYIAAFQDAVTPGVTWDPQPPPPGGAGGVNYDAAAKQLVQDKVDIIVTAGNLAAVACTKASQTIPVVVAAAGDFTGLKGNNWTGCYNGQIDDQILKARVALMMQRLNPTGVGVVGNDNVPPVKTAMSKVLGLLPKNFGFPLPLQQGDLQNVNTIQTKLASLPNTVNVLYVCSDPLVRTHGNHVVTAAHGQHPQRHFKTMHEFGEWHTKHGGDQCYGPDFTQLFLKAVDFVNQYLSTKTLPAPWAPGVQDCMPLPP